jgi:hypothetical protein
MIQAVGELNFIESQHKHKLAFLQTFASSSTQLQYQALKNFVILRFSQQMIDPVFHLNKVRHGNLTR